MRCVKVEARTISKSWRRGSHPVPSLTLSAPTAQDWVA